MNLRLNLIFFLILFLAPCIIHAMVFDNRYFPLIQEPSISIPDRPSHLRFDAFMTTGNKADGKRNGVHIGIPEIYGTFDLSFLARAFELVGLPNPLTPAQTAGSLPFTMQGKVQTQGISFSYYQNISHRIGFGFYLMAMQSDSSLDFFFKSADATIALSPSEKVALEASLRQMVTTLGESCNHVHQGGFGDIDLFVQGGDRWEYLYKLRSIESWLRLGVLIPTGQRKKIFEPASVPFGGDGFWGLYASLFGEFEIREDWKAGLLLRASKRFAHVRTERMPVDLEQPLFGVLVGDAQVTPGWTGIFSPYVIFENLRAGLGFRGQYTLIAHQKDRWQDRRCCDAILPSANVCALQNFSGWASEYITLTGFYDFGKMKVERCHEPIIVLSWYIPVALLVANNSVRSYKVSLGVEYSF
jgi:hypothetical protein